MAKANAARERNLKEKGKSPEERAAAKAKADADKSGIKCAVCLQTFMTIAKDELLYNHVQARHEKLEPEKCFPRLKGYDPSKPPAPAPAPVVAKKKAPPKKKENDVADLLSAGLAGAKSKKR